jgi:hypothetical protein
VEVPRLVFSFKRFERSAAVDRLKQFERSRSSFVNDPVLFLLLPLATSLTPILKKRPNDWNSRTFGAGVSAQRLERSETIDRLERFERSAAIERLERLERP